MMLDTMRCADKFSREGVFSGSCGCRYALICAESLAWQQAEDDAQGGENRGEVDSGGAAGMSGQISCHEYLVGCSHCHQEENALSQYKPQGKTDCQENDALGFAQGLGGLPTIEYPNRDQIQQIEEGPGAGQPGP